MRRQFMVAVLTGLIVTGSTAGAYAAISRSDEPVSYDVTNTALPATGPQEVTPRPGMRNVRPIAWREATALDSDTVRVLFDSGVEPCYVLDHVTVDYRADKVIITLYQGSDPEFGNTACIMISLKKVTEVTLSEPLRGRAIVDGARTR